jgi:hypothetical protein
MSPTPACPSSWRLLGRRLALKLRRARAIYEGVFFAPYRSQLRRAAADEEDLFLLLAVSELLGVPNPVGFFTLELYPHLVARFHDWHRRMGMPRAPEGGFRCC